MAKKTLGVDAGKEIVFSVLKGFVTKSVKQLHLTLGEVIPKSTDRKNFRDQVVKLVSDRNFLLKNRIPFDARARIRDIIGSISATLPGAPSIPEPDKPVPRVPRRRKPGKQNSREEKKAKPSGS
jgi:hypothetical protein